LGSETTRIGFRRPWMCHRDTLLIGVSAFACLGTHAWDRAPLLGRVSTVVDGTGVGRAFTDMIREAGVVFTPVTITGGGNQSRGENGYWNVSKMLLLSEFAAHLESGRLRIISTPMGQELISELNSFEVDFTSAGNMRVDVRSKDHHGDLVIATALALWSAVGKPSGVIEVGKLENYW
jgi:hypothetical protein